MATEFGRSLIRHNLCASQGGAYVHIMHIVITRQLTDKYITPLRAGMQIPRSRLKVCSNTGDGNKLRRNVSLRVATFVCQVICLTTNLTDPSEAISIQYDLFSY